MSAHIAGGILCFIFGVLLVLVGAVFYKPAKTSSYSLAVHLVIFSLGSVLILGGSGWFWWAVS